MKATILTALAVSLNRENLGEVERFRKLGVDMEANGTMEGKVQTHVKLYTQKNS